MTNTTPAEMTEANVVNSLRVEEPGEQEESEGESEGEKVHYTYSIKFAATKNVSGQKGRILTTGRGGGVFFNTYINTIVLFNTYTFQFDYNYILYGISNNGIIETF